MSARSNVANACLIQLACKNKNGLGISGVLATDDDVFVTGAYFEDLIQGGDGVWRFSRGKLALIFVNMLSAVRISESATLSCSLVLAAL